MVNRFTTKAEQVSAFVSFPADVEEVFEKCITLCIDKKACARDGQKTIASPDLTSDHMAELNNLCLKNGIELVRKNIRQYEQGVDLGITLADFAIAETGTLVINSDGEDRRLTSMISDLHVVLVHENDIRESTFDMEDDLKQMTRRAGSYTAFITGASRTADIERVLALGVHGPLELHIMILREDIWHGPKP